MQCTGGGGGGGAIHPDQDTTVVLLSNVRVDVHLKRRGGTRIHRCEQRCITTTTTTTTTAALHHGARGVGQRDAVTQRGSHDIGQIGHGHEGRGGYQIRRRHSLDLQCTPVTTPQGGQCCLQRRRQERFRRVPRQIQDGFLCGATVQLQLEGGVCDRAVSFLYFVQNNVFAVPPQPSGVGDQHVHVTHVGAERHCPRPFQTSRHGQEFDGHHIMHVGRRQHVLDGVFYLGHVGVEGDGSGVLVVQTQRERAPIDTVAVVQSCDHHVGVAGHPQQRFLVQPCIKFDIKLMGRWSSRHRDGIRTKNRVQFQLNGTGTVGASHGRSHLPSSFHRERIATHRTGVNALHFRLGRDRHVDLLNFTQGRGRVQRCTDRRQGESRGGGCRAI